MKNLFTKSPITSIVGLVLIILFAVDVYRNGVHTNNLAILAAGIGLLKAADSGVKDVQNNPPE